MQDESGEAAVERLADELRAARHGGRRRQVAQRIRRLEPATAAPLAQHLLHSCAHTVTSLAESGGLDPDAHLDALRRMLLRRSDGLRRRREVAGVIVALRPLCGGPRPASDQISWTPTQLIDLVDIEHALGHAARVGAPS